MTDNESWHDYARMANFNLIFSPHTPLFIGGRGYNTGNIRWSNTWADILIIAKEILDASK